jgi:iron complex outermembrane receptor protein
MAMFWKKSIFSVIAIVPMILGAQNVSMDTVTVTATKIETGTKDVSQSISVVDTQTIEDKNILNISEALEGIPGVQAESSSNSPSPRLIIRGAGLKASYGVREIMVIKDGVPMTDPDSFTRFDYIDMQDVQSVEVQKGPGSINAVNATGGVIQLLTKSVFEEDKNSIKIGLGDDGQQNLSLKLRSPLGDNDFASITFSKRNIDNDWRDNNNFDSTQFSLKYGHIFADYATFETELAYTESNSQLPSSMTASEFETFKDTGEQHDTSNTWQDSARDSKIFSINAKYEKQFNDAWTLKPRFYFNHWEHFHPVTGLINDSDDNNVFGTDLEANYEHTLFSNKADMVFGLTAKQDRTRDAKKYEYADVVYSSSSSWPYTAYISSTLSNDIGNLANTEDSTTSLYGLYFMESFSPYEKVKMDFSTRIDKLEFDISGNEITAYDYTTKDYITGEGFYNIDKSYTLFSSKLGFTYELSNQTNIYTSVAFANQAPTTSELGDNEDLDSTTSVNYEIGLKARAQNFAYDVALYQNDVEDEIIKTQIDGESLYDNAGKTRKRGLEFNGKYQLSENLSIGASYAYSHFKYISFQENVRGTFISRDGNYLPYIPKHQYSFNATYKLANGFKTRIQTKSWGSYYMDNANSQKYDGYDFVTDLMVGYEKNEHTVQLNVNNVFNKYYAMEATKDVYGNETYKAAAPRSVMLTYTYKF